MHILSGHSFSRLVLLLPIVLLSFFFFTKSSYAAGSLYLAPGSKNVYQGTNFSVSVRMNTGGEPVNAAQANLSYPADKLDFVGIGSGGSAFSIAAPSGGGGGNVSISRGVIGAGITGDKLVAAVTFRPKAGATGVATVSFSGGSALVRGTDQANIIGGMVGGNYTIGSGPAPTSSTGTQAKTPTPLSPLLITDVKVTNLSYNTATIEWITNKPASSIVEYGINTNYGLVEENTEKKTSHAVILSSELLTPGTTYHYRVKNVDEENQESVSLDSTFVTKGLSLIVDVQNENGNPLSNRIVTLVTPQGVVKGTTDTNGSVEFKNIAPVTHTVLVEENGTTKTAVVAIKAPSEKEIQEASVKPQRTLILIAGVASKPFYSPAILLGLIILISLSVIAGFLLKRRKQHISSGL